MNAMITFDFERLRTRLTEYKNEIDGIFAAYRRDVEQVRRTYRDDVADPQCASLAAAARQKIASADTVLSTGVSEIASKLRAALQRHVTEPAPAEFLGHMRTLKEFGLTVTKSELETYAHMAGGNHTALRILADVANASGFVLESPQMKDFESDLSQIESLAHVPVMYCPMDFVSEGVELLPNKQIQGYDMGRPDASYLITRNILFENGLNEIDAMARRWGSSMVPKLTEVQEYISKKDESKKEDEVIEEARKIMEDTLEESASNVKMTDEQATRLAEARAADLAKEHERSEAILRKFMI